MPELPEVETIRRELAEKLVGIFIEEVEADPSLRFQNAKKAEHSQIKAVRRRGKYLILEIEESLKPERELIIHLGMTGVLEYQEKERTEKHTRFLMKLSKGFLHLKDARKFGRVEVVEKGNYEAFNLLGKLGAEPLSESFTPDVLQMGMNKSTASLKAKLLDQRVVAGTGNIYADEALWLAKIHPEQKTLDEKEARALHKALREVLEKSIERKGTTLRDYRTGNGEKGGNQEYLYVYGKAGENCKRCQSSLSSKKVAGRGTTFCPSCQKLPS